MLHSSTDSGTPREMEVRLDALSAHAPGPRDYLTISTSCSIRAVSSPRLTSTYTDRRRRHPWSPLVRAGFWVSDPPGDGCAMQHGKFPTT